MITNKIKITMKAIMKKSGIFLLFLFATLNLFSQEIQIALNFTGDTTISPFEGIERITELSMEGSATLNHDTSLVRLIMKDENGRQYMIFESYALICPDMRISYENYCDETCVS